MHLVKTCKERKIVTSTSGRFAGPLSSNFACRPSDAQGCQPLEDVFTVYCRLKKARIRGLIRNRRQETIVEEGAEEEKDRVWKGFGQPGISSPLDLMYCLSMILRDSSSSGLRLKTPHLRCANWA